MTGGELTQRIAIVLLVYAFCLALGAAVTKGLWALLEMGDWTGLGPIPWPCAFFFAVMFAGRVYRQEQR